MLKDKSILVTGAAGNLGAAVCRRLEADGARVFRVARRPLAGALQSDLSSEAEVEKLFDAAGELDAAVHTVGGWAGGAPVAETDLRVLDQLIATNLRTSFALARSAMRRFSARRAGRLVFVASYTAARGIGLANSAAYAASKSALIALVRALAEEGAPLGVQCNCVAPGTLRTPQNASAMPSADQSRWVALEDVASAIAFLCSAQEVNGSIVELP